MPLNPIEEAKFKKLRDDCRVLGVPAPPEIHIGLRVVDRNGVLLLEDKQRGHSWTRNWYNALLSGVSGATATSAIFGAGDISGKDTSGIARGVVTIGAGGRGTAFSLDGYIYKVAAGSVLNGIIVGTNDDPFSAENYQLGALITEGIGAGQLSYAAQDIPVSSYDNTPGSEKWTITHERVMTNGSGGDIVVAETGLIWGTANTTIATRFQSSISRFLDERSVLSPAVTVPDGSQLTVTYDILMDFSTID